MAERLYQNTPYAEPEGFWPRLLWWLRQEYRDGERWERDHQREQVIRADERRRVLEELLEAPDAE